jgi:hypothetical protein
MVQVLQGGGLVEEEGVVLQGIKVVDALEGGDNHPEEGEGTKESEEGHDSIEQASLSYLL